MPLHLEGIRHSHGSVAALDTIDPDIADGETVALIGPSGCDKCPGAVELSVLRWR